VRLLRGALRVLVAGLALSAAVVVVYRFVDPPVTPLMVLRVIEGRAGGRAVGIDRQWVGLELVSPALLRAVLAAEDARFLVHRGVDWDALARARAYNLRQQGRRRRGGSTITMQCARNLFLWPGRSYVRKGLEVYLAMLLEGLWDKRRILEVYLNVIEWGDGVYGVERAARRAFGVPAARLDARQAALLAAVLPGPRRWSASAPTPFLARRAAVIEARAARVPLGGLGRR
jgi:monofunctional biosynthetic peptidoglycan transglycosylase